MSVCNNAADRICLAEYILTGGAVLNRSRNSMASPLGPETRPMAQSDIQCIYIPYHYQVPPEAFITHSVHPLITSQPSMVNFHYPNLVASEICTNAFQSHWYNIMPALSNTLLDSGTPEVLARTRRFIYVRLPPPTLPRCLALLIVNSSPIAGSSSTLLIMSGGSYQSVGPTSRQFGLVATPILGFVIPLK